MRFFELAFIWWYKKKNVRKAWEYLMLAKKQDISKYELSYWLLKGDLLKAMGKISEAKKCYETGLKLSGEDPLGRKVFSMRLKEL